MRHLCKVCGVPTNTRSRLCERHAPAASRSPTAVLPWLVLLAACLITLFNLLTWGIAPAPPPPAPTPTPTPTPPPTPSPPPQRTLPPPHTPTPTPLPPLNKAARLSLSSADHYYLATLIDLEAGGMPYQARYLVACNILFDLHDVGGDWSLLRQRWSPLGRILDGHAFPNPSPDARDIAHLASSTDDCANFPACAFLGNPADVRAWQSHSFLTDGRHDLWLGPAGQMLVCIHGAPDLPTPPGK